MKKIFCILSSLRHRFKIFFAFMTKLKKNRVIIVATPTHGNLGDQAIVYAEKKAIKAILPGYSIIEIENGAFLKHKNLLKRFVRKRDVVIVDGGGNLGTLWPWEDDKITDIISTFSQNKIVVFPQTVFYDSTDLAKERIVKNMERYAQARDLTILLRDKKSNDFFNTTFPMVKAKLCPDIVLSLNENRKAKREGILLCFRSDRERAVQEDDYLSLEKYLNETGIRYSKTDTVIAKTIVKSNRKRELSKKWEEFCSAKLVITDRLHAMIFAFITNTPCIAINNSSKKVEGSFQFIHDSNFIVMAQSITDVVEKVSVLMKIQEIDKGDFKYPIKIIEETLTNADTK